MGNQPKLSQHRKRDRIYGLLIIVLAFGGCMGLSVWGMRVSTPRAAPAPPPASKDDIAGFPKAVRPFDVLERARALSVRQKFQGFEARGVRSNGTVDLSKSGASLRLAFQSPQGRGPQPERKPGTLPDRRYCGTQSVVVDKKGISALEDRTKVPCGGREIEDLGVPSGCTIQDIVRLAEKRKKFQKKKGTVSVEYYKAQDGPAFRYQKGNHSVVISARDCKKELKGRAQRGSVPRR